MATAVDREQLIAREPGEDVEITLRLRQSAWSRLTGAGLPVSGVMQLVNADDGAYVLAVWSAEKPDWPEPIPGNEAARDETLETLEALRDGVEMGIFVVIGERDGDPVYAITDAGCALVETDVGPETS